MVRPLSYSLTNIEKEVKYIAKRNEGKNFESQFIKFVPEYCWHKRLNDNAASWSSGTNTRFTSNNECDFLLYDCNTRTLTALELKTTQSSLTYWRKDFDNDGKKHTYNIKRNQILGLQDWSKFYMNCGFVFNFRTKSNRTFFVTIQDFLNYTSALKKKSINMTDVLKMNPIEIENELLRTNYRYNIEKFLKDIHL